MSDQHWVMTGPIQGSVTLDDGRVIDVTPHFIQAESPEIAAQIADKVGQHYEKWGHPEVEGDFQYVRNVPAEG